MDERAEALSTQLRETFSHLNPVFVEEWDNSYNIFADKYNILDNIPLAQRVLADLLRPIKPGEHKRILHVYLLDPINMLSDTECEVHFLFKWVNDLQVSG